MRIYFMSEKDAFLKINGIYLGIIGWHEKFLEADLRDALLIEIIPRDPTFSCRHFSLDEKLLTLGCSFAKIYKHADHILINIVNFARTELTLKVYDQKKNERALATLFDQGGVYLSIEGENFAIHPLGDDFIDSKIIFSEKIGYPIIYLKGKTQVIICDESGKILLSEAADEIVEEDGKIIIQKSFPHLFTKGATKTYCYDGEKLTLERLRFSELCLNANALPYAFFECLLSGADVSPLLDDDLIGKTSYLGEFFGKFSEVIPPPQAKRNDFQVALAYHEGANVYSLKYVTVQMKDGKIENFTFE